MPKTETRTIDLTAPFLIWAAVWTAVALATHNLSLLWIAAMPVLIWSFIVAVVMSVAIVAMAGIYLNGGRIKFTNRKGEVKYYQRKRR